MTPRKGSKSPGKGMKSMTPRKGIMHLDERSKRPTPQKSFSWSANSRTLQVSASQPPPITKAASVSLGKFKQKRNAEKMTLKRAFSDQETDSGFDSGYSCEKDGAIKKVSVGNPFSRSDYTTDSSDAQFDVFSLPAALNVVEPSPLVGVLRKEDKKGSLPTNTDSYLEEEHAKRSLTVNPNVPTKVAYVPYRDFYDWSLKTKLRVTSSKDLQWMKQSSADRIKGPTTLKKKRQAKEARFMKLVRYWIFPFLNGVRTFPRQNNGDAVTDWRKIMPGLQKDWELSLSELWETVICGECPYFYINTHQWTTLVLSKEVSKSAVWKAYMTPTTRGLRETLTAEGVRFQMPLRPVHAGNSEDLNVSSGSDGSSEEHSSLKWITEKCMAVGKFSDRCTEDEKENSVDFRPESLISFEGAEVDSFIRAVLRLRSLQPSGGILLNVPPTLIAPTSFVNATSKRLEYTVGTANGSWFLEIPEGPILPHFIPALSQLQSEDQKADKPNTSGAIFATLDHSSTFARITVPLEKADHFIEPDTQTLCLESLLPDIADPSNNPRVSMNVSEKSMIKSMSKFLLV